MKIAVWQTASVSKDVGANLERLRAVARRAAEAGAGILVTPEMQLTGYCVADEITRLADEAPLEQAREIAREARIAIIACGPERLSADAIANSAWLISDTGEVLARHRKIQLFGDLDRSMFAAGDEPFTVAEYRGVRVGMLICFDVEFPETVRAAALAGADFVAVPTAQMQPFEFVNQHLIRVRAWENTVYLAYANHIGTDADLTYVGQSVIADPFGEHLAYGSNSAEELLFAELSHERITEARALNPHLREVRRDVFADPQHS